MTWATRPAWLPALLFSIFLLSRFWPLGQQTNLLAEAPQGALPALGALVMGALVMGALVALVAAPHHRAGTIGC